MSHPEVKAWKHRIVKAQWTRGAYVGSSGLHFVKRALGGLALPDAFALKNTSKDSLAIQKVALLKGNKKQAYATLPQNFPL